MRAAHLLGLALLAGCGRWGFDGGLDAGALDPDADAGTAVDDAVDAALIDAAPMIDAAPGADYTVTVGSSQYPGLAAGAPVPGFVTGADDETYAMTLPFSFKLYGIAYSSININVNGFVTFGAAPTGVDAYLNDCILDATSPSATIAVFWDDLFSNTSTAPSGSVDSAQGGTAPDRWFAIEWRDLDAYYRAGAGNNSFSQGLRVTHLLVLRESGVIEMRYGPRTAPALDRDCGLDRHRGCSATIGVEAAGDSPTRTIQCGDATGPLTVFAPIDPGTLITLTPK